MRRAMERSSSAMSVHTIAHVLLGLVARRPHEWKAVFPQTDLKRLSSIVSYLWVALREVCADRCRRQDVAFVCASSCGQFARKFAWVHQR